MIGEIIAIGDELTSGRIANTTSTHAARELFFLGHRLRAIHTIGDEPGYIGKVLQEAIAHCDFVIVTGGLGPTSDDLTNEAVTAALHLKTAMHPDIRAYLETRYQGTKHNAFLCNKMARLPEGAELLDDACRMAGYLLRYRGKPIYILPGVPPEMKFLLHDKVLPGLRTLEGERSTPVRQEVYRTCGLREIDINQALHPLEEDRFLQIGYYPVDREVHISLTVRDYLGEEGEARFSRADAFIRKALGPALYGTGEKGLPSVLGEMLSARGFTLCTAESCTGGLLGATITAGPGSSQWFRGGVIAYANTLKESLLGVSPETLSRHGAVSAETARAMARGAAERLGGDLAVAVTGIAGPGGGTTDKPVGTVYLGLWHQGRLSDQLCRFDGNDRRRIQEKTVQEALNMVRCALLS